MEIREVSAALGAEVLGIDIKSIGDAEYRAVRDAFLTHSVLVFRDQDLDLATLVHFSQLWGEIQVNPIFPYVDGHAGVLEINNMGKEQAVTENWHYDSTFTTRPPALTILSMQQMPSIGGDTMWSNQYAAYDRLSDRTKDIIKDLRGVFTGTRVARARGGDQEIPQASHPIVRTHPDTGRKALFIGNPEETLTHFEGMTSAESQPLLRFLYVHSVEPDNIYRHVWRNKDVAMWDNRCTMHYAVHDYGSEVRRLYRTTIEGDIPR